MSDRPEEGVEPVIFARVARIADKPVVTSSRWLQPPQEYPSRPSTYLPALRDNSCAIYVFKLVSHAPIALNNRIAAAVAC